MMNASFPLTDENKKKEKWQSAWRRVPYAVAPATLLLLAFALGTIYFSHYEGTPANYQEFMGPAVMVASGRGFINPNLEALPELKAFLTPLPSLTERPPIDCFDPATLPAVVPQLPVEGYQIRHQYLFYTVAAVWKLTGISWSALAPLYGLFYAFSAMAFYALFRLAVSRPTAFLGSLLLVFSPMQLNNLLRLRDYAKAPFLLAAIAIAIFLLQRTVSRRALFGWAAAAGVVLGVGYGFRQDTFIAMPAISVVLLFFLGGIQHPWRIRLASVAVAWAAFYAASFPAQREMDASEKYHHLVQGLCGIYDGRLGAGGVPYTVVHRYFDIETIGIFQTYTKHREGAFRTIELSTQDYEDVGRDYSRELFGAFPADFLLRSWMAVRRTIDEMGADPGAAAPRGVANPWMDKLATGRAYLHAALVRYSHYGVPLALLLVAAFHLRRAFGLFFLLCFFGGYAAIQFAGRHNFHLQFVSLIAMLFLLERGWTLLRTAKRPTWNPTPPWRIPELQRCTFFAVAFLLLLFVPLSLARVYQQHHMQMLLQNYSSAPLQALECHDVPEADTRVSVTLSRSDGSALFNAPPRETGFDAAYLMAEFDTTRGPINGWVEYAASQFDFAPDWDFVLTITQSGTTRIFFPVYAFHRPATPTLRETSSYFRGLVLPASNRAKLVRVAEVQNAQQYPLWLTATLAPEWETQALFQRRTR